MKQAWDKWKKSLRNTEINRETLMYNEKCQYTIRTLRYTDTLKNPETGWHSCWLRNTNIQWETHIHWETQIYTDENTDIYWEAHILYF